MSAVLFAAPHAVRPPQAETPHAASPAASDRSHGGLATLLRRPVAALLALAAAVLTAYAPSLNGQFLWDDTALVLHNLFIRSPLFCLEVFRHTLFNGDSNFYRPAQTLVFIADYYFCAFDPFGYHLTSILIHAINAFLLFLVLKGILPTLLPDRARGDINASLMAFGIALVWSLHPVHSAAVAYVSGSADSLAMLFCLTAWLCCERALSARPLPRLGWITAASAAFLLGLCSKEIAFVWLLLFTGSLFLLRRKETAPRARWAVLGTAAVVLLAYAGLRHLPPAPPAPPPMPPLPAKGLLMLRALGDYGSLMLFPDKLFMERQVFAAPGLANPEDASVYTALAAAGVGMLLAFAAGAVWPGRGRNLRRFGAGWFMLGFLPISNLFSLNASVAEHWLYLPSIGFLLFLAGVALDLPLSSIPRRRAVQIAAAIVLLAAGALGVRTWHRTFDWSDELTFFRQTIADGGDVPRARAGLAAAYSRQHDDTRAVAVLREVVGKYPNVLSSRINLANALSRQGQTDEAKSILEKTAADLLAQNGDPREIVVTIHSLDRLEGGEPAWTAHRRILLDTALRRRPDSWELVQLGVQDGEAAHDPARALALLQSFTQRQWWHAPAWYATGCIDDELGHTDDALAAWTRASRYDVHDAEAPSAAAMLCLQQNRLDEARDFQSRAVRAQPDSPKQHALFAQVLSRRGENTGAAAQTAIVNSLVQQAH